MHRAPLLAIDQIVPEMTSTEFRGAIAELVDHLTAGRLPGSITKGGLVDQFLRREELVSTGVGSGVAIPHIFVPGLDGVLTVFGRSRSGIDFGAHDDAPVYFVVLFVVPEAEYQLHLRTLGAIAKLFAATEVRERLAAASGAEEIHEILSKRLARTQAGA